MKYAMLKVGAPSDIAFDIETSVSFDGDSGPYLQYTYARCRSVLRKAKNSSIGDLGTVGDASLNPEERALARLINYFPEIVAQAASQLAPNVLCTYLFRLAQAFNLFYAKHQILGTQDLGLRTQDVGLGTRFSPTSYVIRPMSASLRLSLTAATAQVLKNGLYLLGIETLEQM